MTKTKAKEQFNELIQQLTELRDKSTRENQLFYANDDFIERAPYQKAMTEIIVKLALIINPKCFHDDCAETTSSMFLCHEHYGDWLDCDCAQYRQRDED